MSKIVIERCDCCGGKLVPSQFWSNGDGECRCSISRKGYCKGFSSREVEALEEALEEEAMEVANG